MRHGDDHWFDVVKWSLFATIEAEELELTSKNVDQQAKNANPVVQRFLGAKGDFGKLLRLDNRWAYNIVKQVGNYGESFETNVGLKTPLALARGLNELWSKGGLLYAPPIR